MRVLIAGMGSAVGAGLALELERFDDVEAIAGFDLEPPRRWIRRADFQYAEPADRERIEKIVGDFGPTVVVHAWVFEPRSRSSPGQARARTVAATESLLGAIAQLDTVAKIVVRSGASIYGRQPSRSGPPTVETAPRPTSNFGEMLVRVEDRSAEVGDSIGAAVTLVRFAPVMASNLPNPLGRYLRLRVVPVPITTHRFGLVHLNDAARVLAAAVRTQSAGPVNVIADDPLTVFEAVRIGRRLPLPVLPVVLRAVRGLAELVGAPIPEHVIELLSHGLLVAPTDLATELGMALERTTRDTIEDLYSAGRLVDLDGAAAPVQP